MKLRISIIIFSFLMLVSAAQAQTYSNKMDSLVNPFRVKQADKAFDNMAYAKSIRRYEPLYQKGYLADSIKPKLAQAYLKVQETEKAEEVYASVNADYLVGEDLFFFAQALKYNGKYAEADTYMAKYLINNAEDSRALKQNNALPVIEKILSEERYLVEPVDFNSSQSDFGAFVVDDHVVFSSAREVDVVIRREYAWKETPYLNIFTSKIKDGGHGKAQLLSTQLKSMYHDGPVSVNTERTELFITRNTFNNLIGKKGVDGTNHLNLMVASKQIDGTWGKPVDLPFNDVSHSTGHGFITKDGQRLYFASDREEGLGGSDIWYVNRTSNGWSEPINMGDEVNTEGDEMFPFVDADGKLYFASNGHLGLGGLDLFVASERKGSYRVHNMGYPINSEKDDFSLFLMDDGINGYFASNRSGGKGDDDIYRFKILNAVSFKKHFKSKLIDKNTRQIIANTPVLLKNPAGDIIAELMSDAEGMVASELPLEMAELSLVVNAVDYYPYANVIDVSEDVDEHEMELIPLPVYGIYGNVFLLPDMTAIPEVNVLMVPAQGEQKRITSNEDGTFKTRLEPDMEYDLVFTKKEFFTKRLTYSTMGRDTGYVNVNEFVELELEKAEVGKSIEIEILYDLGKWNIREDAATELNDMVQFLQDNPTIKIELGSHTDARGSASSNQVLSQKRAESAVAYMLERGIDKSRIQAKGYGETRLKNKCADGVRCSELEHQANRRSEVTIIAM
ncbi:OmpA family protein [Carboxylicivirga sp. M1479]|uniref:OmpA family protein n=1 Tax=Carboxylicivirga sp. M1479 TaxID=2594476 RepID=UPI001177F197|nr:OmpA family protein [Carboxylicivirga sp. M1479]TRX70926.1 OmpA family protein [Carboxylicivirga sp. M1479]